MHRVHRPYPDQVGAVLTAPVCLETQMILTEPLVFACMLQLQLLTHPHTPPHQIIFPLDKPCAHCLFTHPTAPTQVAILNGAQKGVPGGGITGGGTAKEAASMALLYDPEAPAGSRISTLASSGIHRWVVVMSFSFFAVAASVQGVQGNMSVKKCQTRLQTLRRTVPRHTCANCVP
jgi:hypothetical protein